MTSTKCVFENFQGESRGCGAPHEDSSLPDRSGLHHVLELYILCSWLNTRSRTRFYANKNAYNLEVRSVHHPTTPFSKYENPDRAELHRAVTFQH
jgi:hypothetical protein